MSNFLWIIIIVGIVWYFLSQKSQDKAIRSFSASDEAAPWFHLQEIDPESVLFSTYDDPDLLTTPNAILLVGKGNSKDGDIGFAVEVVPGKGPVVGFLFNRPGLASHHKSIAAKSKAMGLPFIDVAMTMQ